MKLIIVTGATAGIGRATAKHFKENGWEVVGTSRKKDARWVLDITSPDSVANLIENVLSEFGQIDAVFNNIGFAQIGSFEEFGFNAHEDAFKTNLFGAMRMSHAVLPILRKQGSGTLVHMGSVVSHLPAPFMGSYAATKHALEGFSKSLDHELHGTGLRSILIRAGFMKSSIAANTVFASSETNAIPAGRAAVKRSVDQALSSADDPTVVAGAVFNACVSEKCPSVIDAGKEARTLQRLSKFLPNAVFERAFRKQFGLS